MATPANTPNIPINAATGYTASIATNVVGGAHYQVFKMSYGDTSSASIVSSGNPLPVILSAGVTANIVNFTTPVIVVGNTAGDPVKVQGTVNILGVTGSPLAITGGIARNYTRDSFAVYGYNGNTFIPTTLVGSGGVAVGMSGSAIRVSVQDVTVTAYINPVIYIDNYGSTSALRIQGNTGGIPVSVSVSGTAAIYDTNILNGMTAIYAQVVGLRSDLGGFAVTRPSSFKNGRVSTTTSTTQLDASGFTSSKGVNIKALSTNTDFVYVGNTSPFTGSSVGFAMDPGDSIFLDISNTNKIWIQSNSGTQVVTYLAS
jgi:hypothetical protein